MIAQIAETYAVELPIRTTKPRTVEPVRLGRHEYDAVRFALKRERRRTVLSISLSLIDPCFGLLPTCYRTTGEDENEQKSLKGKA
jgi:hypothetical protein